MNPTKTLTKKVNGFFSKEETWTYELFEYSTHAMMKITRPEQQVKVIVHTGKLSYINKLWKEQNKN